MNSLETRLSEKEQAHLRLLSEAKEQFAILLTQLGPDGQLTRELALANTRIDEAYLWAREHVLGMAAKRNRLN